MRYIEDLKTIFQAGVDRADPYRLMKEVLSRQGDRLRVGTESKTREISLDDFHAVYVMGTGKAAAKMALAVEELLADRIDEGVITTKYDHGESLDRIRVVEAGHPVPDENGIAGARAMAELAKRADERTLVINLISGGGSALLPFPYENEDVKPELRISLAEKQQTTRALLACGATIHEINCLRKHLSMIKGGRLAEMIHPGVCISFILSDVVGDDLDVIASGPTVPDDTTYSDAIDIVEKFDMAGELPHSVMAVLDAGLNGWIPDTPNAQSFLFQKVENLVIGSNALSLHAAAEKARTLGYETVVLSSRIQGEAKEVAKVLYGIAADVRKRHFLLTPPACILAGGETTVTVTGKGKGGRNQEMALAFLAEMEKNRGERCGIHFLSGATDGGDGPTDAAGAFASEEILRESEKKAVSANNFLKDNDSFTFFDKIGFLYRTGPTRTNVCDIQVLLVAVD